MTFTERIEVNPRVMLGKAVIRGTLAIMICDHDLRSGLREGAAKRGYWVTSGEQKWSSLGERRSLRADLVWNKPNCQSESVKDRADALPRIRVPVQQERTLLLRPQGKARPE